MANIKDRYGEITRKAKASDQHRERGAPVSSAVLEEARLAARIRERVRLDYRTLSSQKPAKQD